MVPRLELEQDKITTKMSGSGKSDIKSDLKIDIKISDSEEKKEIASNNLTLFHIPDNKIYPELIVSNPDSFIEKLLDHRDYDSIDMARKLDRWDPLRNSAKEFDKNKNITFCAFDVPFFRPSTTKIGEVIYKNQKPDTDDRNHELLSIMKELTGFKEDDEFIFSGCSASQNLITLMQDFYRPGFKGKIPRNKIIIPDIKPYTDYALEIVNNALEIADQYECFNDNIKPTAEDLIIKIVPDNKIFRVEDILKLINENSSEAQIIILPDVIMETGQRLPIETILEKLNDNIRKNNIIVGLELSHTIGIKKIDLKSLPVVFAVGYCDKFLTGFGSNISAIYVDNTFKPAMKYRKSTPSYIDFIAIKEFFTYFHQKGFDQYFNKSECLIRYLIAMLKLNLKDSITILTSENSDERANRIVIQINGLKEITVIEDYLKSKFPVMGNFRMEVSQPDSISIFIHYGYTSFRDIHQLVSKMGYAIKQVPHINKVMDFSIIEVNKMFTFNWNDATTVDHWTDFASAMSVKINQTNLQSIDKKEIQDAYVLLNYKLGTYYVYIESDPVLALEKLYTAERYYAEHPELILNLAWTKVHCVYAYHLLISKEKINDGDTEASLQEVRRYITAANKCLLEIDSMYMNNKGNEIEWTKVMSYAKYVLLLLRYESDLHKMICEKKYKGDVLDEDINQIVTNFKCIFMLYDKLEIMDDNAANMKNTYAKFLIKIKKYDEAQLVFESIEKYWAKYKDKERENLYIKRFCDDYKSFKSKNLNTDPALEKRASKRRLSDLVVYHKNSHFQQKTGFGEKISPRSSSGEKISSKSTSSDEKISPRKSHSETIIPRKMSS